MAFFLRKTLESIAIIPVQEAAARSFVPAWLHSPRALLLRAVFLLQQANTVALEQSRLLGSTALFELADPLLGPAIALIVPEESSLSSRATFLAAMFLFGTAFARSILGETPSLTRGT